MKILIGINTLSSGGAEVFATEIAVSYLEKGNDVLFVYFGGILNKKGEDLLKNLENRGVKTIDLSSISRLLLIFKYHKIVSQFKPDLVHSNLEQTDFLLGITKIFNRKSLYIRTLHNIKVFQKFPYLVHKFLFKLYDYNVGCSAFTKTHFEIPSLKDQIQVIDNGISISRVNALTVEKKQLQEQLKIQPSDIVFIMIGTSQKRFGEYQKGHDLIFDLSDKLPSNIKILFLGNISNIEKDFPLAWKDSRFLFLGVQNNISNYLNISDFLLAPSRFEGLPISTIEAACFGIPLLCSDIEGFLPFDTDSTIFFNNNNKQDLLEKIIKAMDQSQVYKLLAEKNKKKYTDKFDVNNVTKKYLNLMK